MSDMKNIKSKTDRHAVLVLDRNRMEFCALFHGDCDQHELAEQVLQCAKYYHDAWIVPEIPHAMEVLRLCLKDGYTNIFSREKGDDKEETEDTDLLGWRTTTTSRPLLVEGFKTIMAEGNLRLRFIELIDEMRTFIKDKMGKPIHAPGEHDDIIFAAMLALQGHLRCPLDAVPYAYSQTDAYVEREHRMALNVSGCIDYDDDTDEEWLYTD